MTKYVKYVHPRYKWYNLVLREIGERVYLTPNGDIKYIQDILTHTKEDENEAKPNLIYGIIEDDGSFVIEFRNKLYNNIVEAEQSICSSKIKIARLKEFGGIE